MGKRDNRQHLDWLQSQLTAGAIGRREFMGWAVALGVTTALASTMAGRATGAAGPTQGGYMKLAMAHGSTTDTYDPAHLENGFQTVTTYGFTNTLTEVTADGTLAPSLAESWESSPDARVWTFRLRKGVEFHNGKTFTAHDVLANINYHRKPDSKSSLKPLAKPIKEVRVDSDNVVVFELEGGNADFPYSLNRPGFAAFPSTPEGDLAWRDGLGTGGYLLKSFEPGVRAYFERNPNYWKEGRAFADQVELLSITDATARTNALITGEVHAIDSVDLKTANLLSRKPGIHVEETSGPLHYTFPMITTQAPFDDINVRRALKHAVDREEMLAKILHGHGTIGNDNPIGPSYRFHAKDLEQTVYDPDKARHHLRKAGFESLKINLSAADAAFAGAVDAAALYRERAAAAGINIDIVREPNDGYWSNVWMKKPFSACYWAGYETEDTIFTTGYAADASWNDTFWKHERFNKLLVEARAELNEAKRAELYREMQIILRDEGGVVVPMFANAVFARSDKVEHGKVASNAAFDGRRIIERWWVAS